MVYELDNKDKKILACLLMNARFSYSTISKMTGLSRDVVIYRMNKLIREGVINGFYTNFALRRLKLMKLYSVMIKFSYISRKEFNKVIEKLREVPEILELSACEGSFNLIILVASYDYYQVRYVIDKIKDACKTKASEILMLDEVFFSSTISEFQSTLLDLNLKKVTARDGSFDPLLRKKWPKVNRTIKNIEITNLDYNIMKILQENSRTPVRKIASELGVSPQVVIYRIKRLIKERVILGFGVRLDLKQLGYKKIFLLISLQGDRKEKVEFIKRVILEGHASSFAGFLSEWDMLFIFETKDDVALKRLLDDLLDQYSNLVAKQHISWETEFYMPKESFFTPEFFSRKQFTHLFTELLKTNAFNPYLKTAKNKKIKP